MRVISIGIGCFAALLFLVAISSCGGGEGHSGSIITAEANGLWEGTSTETGLGTFTLKCLLYNGRLIAISESAGTIYDGNYSVIGGAISGTLTAYQINSGPFATAHLTGSITERESIYGTYTTSYVTTGTVNLYYNNIYDRGSSFALLTGVWGCSINNYAVTITIDANGRFIGDDSNNCMYNGRILVPDSMQNLYEATVTISQCGTVNGTYSGFAALYDNVSTNDLLQVAVSNHNYIFIYPFIKK